MRLEKSRETLQSGALARVRMFLKADLGWLRGFPLGVRGPGVAWVIVPREDGHAPERTTLGREHILRSVYTYNRLVCRFPHALPRAVEDVGAWKRGVPFLIDLIKPGVQARKPLPPSVLGISGAYSPRVTRAATDLMDRHPHLGRFINALGHILVLTPDELPSALQWADRHASELRNFLTAHAGDGGLISLVAWWELCRRTRYKDAEFLIPIVGDRRAPVIPNHGWAQHLNGLRRAIVDSVSKKSRAKLPARPQPVLMDALDRFAVDGLRQDEAVRRRALNLLSLMLDVDLLGAWQSAWRRLEKTLGARHHLLPGHSPAAVKAEVQRVKARIDDLLRDHPPEIHIETLLDDIWKLSSTAPEEAFQAVCRGLKALPAVQGGILVRAAFLHGWAGRVKSMCLSKWFIAQIQGATPSNPLFATAARRLASYLASSGRTAALLRPWSNILKAWDEGPASKWSVLDDILDDHPDAPTVEMSFRALEKALEARPDGLEYEQACMLVNLVKTLKDPDLALACANRLSAAEVGFNSLWPGLIHAAHSLAMGGEDFGRLFKNLAELENGDADIESILGLDRDLRLGGWGGIVAKAIVSGEGTSVVSLARRRALPSLGGRSGPPARIPGERTPEWISQYPPEFAAALTDLAVLGAKAERTARRVLGQDFIPHAALREEIEALEPKVKGLRESSPLARRLANLRARLAASEAPAAARAGRLRARLDRAVRRALFKAWNERLDEELKASLIETLGVTSIPEAFTGQPFWQVLASIVSLPKGFREIGLELLRRRCGPAPWNLFDHPSNRTFLERISRQGVDVAPWVEPAVIHQVPSRNGRTLRLAFADDPLDIFRMGAHFQTCLSPGGYNFYSTVSNAADVNKRVLYARDESGRVAGRCLFALSDNGGILTFHPYCHDMALGFPEIVSRFAADLASRMRTAVVTKGRVERLVAPKWYDDGPCDTGLRFPCLREGSVFRSQIGHLSPDDIPGAVRRAIAPLVPSALTIPPIIMLPELEERPELVIPLLDLLESREDVPIEVWKRAADLAVRAGRADVAQRVFNKGIVPSLSKQFRGDILNREVIELGLQLDPSALLRVFRQTRPRSIKGDEAEPPERREYIAKAHERLGRKHLAERLRLARRARSN